MGSEERVHRLSIFLIKESLQRSDQIVNKEECYPAQEIQIPGHGKGKLYIKRSSDHLPKWLNLFEGHVENSNLLLVASVGAVFLVKVESHYFALTFGHLGRFLLKDDVWEERFGLISALNSFTENGFRCIDKQSLDKLDKHSRVQSSQETAPYEFGLDVEQDMLKAVVGTPADATMGSRMVGSDSLSVNVSMRLRDLPRLLNSYRTNFEKPLDSVRYNWVNNISEVRKSTSLVAELEHALIDQIANRNFQDIWLAIPAVIDWEDVHGFKYKSDPEDGTYYDVTLNDFLRTVTTGTRITIETLRSRHVYCVDDNHHPTGKQWSIYKCLYAEIDLGDKKYILNDGRWFYVDSNFVTRTNKAYKNIPRSQLKLPTYVGGGEGRYNKSVADGIPGQFALLDDKKKIMHGGAHGQVEVCDLLSTEKQFIHVKRYSKSSVLSHLFSQGLVSANLFCSDESFRSKVRAALDNPFSQLISAQRPQQGEYTVTYAIISESPEPDLHIPFFSRVNINNAARTLNAFGFNVEILKIAVDPNLSKTRVLAPKGKLKRLLASQQNTSRTKATEPA